MRPTWASPTQSNCGTSLPGSWLGSRSTSREGSARGGLGSSLPLGNSALQRAAGPLESLGLTGESLQTPYPSLLAQVHTPSLPTGVASANGFTAVQTGLQRRNLLQMGLRLPNASIGGTSMNGVSPGLLAQGDTGGIRNDTARQIMADWRARRARRAALMEVALPRHEEAGASTLHPLPTECRTSDLPHDILCATSPAATACVPAIDVQQAALQANDVEDVEDAAVLAAPFPPQVPRMPRQGAPSHRA